MEYTKEVLVTQQHIKCDFCNHSTEENTEAKPFKTVISQCAVCGKDICSHHDYDNDGYLPNIHICEDGVLCPDCIKKGYEFDDGLDIGVVDKQGNKIGSPYL